MQLDQLLDMDDEDFERVVMQAVKRREDFPHWWRAVLVPELIDATEQVVKAARDSAEVQALTPGSIRMRRGSRRRWRRCWRRSRWPGSWA